MRGAKCAGTTVRWAITIFLAWMFFCSLASQAEDRAVKMRVAPVYPEIAKHLRISGVVRLEVTVDAEGKVVDVKPLAGNHMLSAAAEDAVRKWKFASGAGQAIVDVDLNFDLAQ